MLNVESIPLGQIKDLPTRDALDRLQRAMQFAFGREGLATLDDLAALRQEVSAIPDRGITKTVIRPAPGVLTGDFVLRAGDTMTGRLGISLNITQNRTQEGLGISNVGRITHDRAENWSNAITYDKGAMVGNNGYIWESLADSNLNNGPALGSAWWRRTSLECQTWMKDTWAVGTTYDAFDTVLDPTTNHIFTSLQDGNVGNDPAAPSPLWWSDADPIDQKYSAVGPTYALGDVVRFGNALWTSLQNSNQGNYPYPYLWDVAKTYRINDQIRHEGLLYSSLANGNVGNQPDITPASWVLDDAYTWWSGATAVVNGAQINSFGLNGAGLGVTFGIACEAWNGPYPTALDKGRATHADRTLIGIEPSVINRNPRSTQAKVGVDVTFKNRADTEFFTPMPLGSAGEDRYNIFARAIQFSAFPRSQTDEYCGWPTLLKVQENSTDISASQPFTVIVDMYDQTVGNDEKATFSSAAGTWWWWWASNEVYDPVGQPLGREAGIRYNPSQKMLEFYCDIVNQGAGTNSLVGAISFDPAQWADQNNDIPMVMNSGLFPMRAVFNETIKFISVGPTSGTNFVNAAATGAAGNPFTNPANIYPTGFLEFHIDGASKRIPYYNP